MTTPTSLPYSVYGRGPGGAPLALTLDVPATWRGVTRATGPWLWEAVYYEHRMAVQPWQVQGVHGQVVRQPTAHGWPWRVWFTGVTDAGSTQTWHTWSYQGHAPTERGAKRAATGKAQAMADAFNQLTGGQRW
jgi:hypothetical protein